MFKFRPKTLFCPNYHMKVIKPYLKKIISSINVKKQIRLGSQALDDSQSRRLATEFKKARA